MLNVHLSPRITIRRCGSVDNQIKNLPACKNTVYFRCRHIIADVFSGFEMARRRRNSRKKPIQRNDRWHWACILSFCAKCANATVTGESRQKGKQKQKQWQMDTQIHRHYCSHKFHHKYFSCVHNSGSRGALVARIAIANVLASVHANNFVLNGPPSSDIS